MNVIIPTSMRAHTGGSKVVAVQGKTMSEAMGALVALHPGLRSHLLDASDQVVSYVNVFVNDTNVRDLDNGDTALTDADEILLVPALAGG